MFSTLPGSVIAYHGTTKAEAERVVHGRGAQHLRTSPNDYDWLGQAVYFWENSAARAEEWASKKHPGDESIIGSVLQLGHCLDLLDQQYINVAEDAAHQMCAGYEALGKAIPVNTPKGANRFDCALIEYIVKDPSQRFGQFDSARAAYIEGDRILQRSAFHRQTHIQIAVYNLNCIKGYFWPQAETFLTSSVGAAG